MAHSITRVKRSVQIVVQGAARKLEEQLKASRIGFQILDQPGPMTLRVGVADWASIRAIAAEHGYERPDFYAQPDVTQKDTFRDHLLRQEWTAAASTRSGGTGDE
jgi:hypothetical protein